MPFVRKILKSFHRASLSQEPADATELRAAANDSSFAKNESNLADIQLPDDKRPPERTWPPQQASLSTLTPTNVPHTEKAQVTRAGAITDPFGLSLLYTPIDDVHSADIIFVHGLGGSSRMTWSMDRDLGKFWPREWLPKHKDLRESRIFTFGYDAKWKNKLQSSSLGISDFSESLLFDMLYSRDEGDSPFHFGQVPIIFVAHSMGGLIVKKAYLDAKADTRYRGFVDAIGAITFLATPHRGAGVAAALDMVLTWSYKSTSKQYVSQIAYDATFLREINEKFEDAAVRLQIFSFYETLKTKVGGASKMLVQPDSARLDYPTEISRPLKADHANICKFDSPQDPNYRAVLGALQHLMSIYTGQAKGEVIEANNNIRCLLSIPNTLHDELERLSTLRTEGTCEWLVQNAHIRSWLSTSSRSGMLFLHGRPGCGKSVAASFLIQHLRERGAAVQHYFFKDDDNSASSIACLLRGLAFQASEQIPRLRKAVMDMGRAGWKPEESHWQSMWKPMLSDLLFRLRGIPPIYWVIDGVDNTPSPTTLLQLLASSSVSVAPIRIILSGRMTAGIMQATSAISVNSAIVEFPIDQISADIELHVRQELSYTPWDTKTVRMVEKQVLARARNSFSWARLVVETLQRCGPADEIPQRLFELPDEMVQVYRRMEETIRGISKPNDRELARHMLLWTMHAGRSLSVNEMKDILTQKFGELTDLTLTARKLCDYFIVIEVDNTIGIVHHTARDYLSQTTSLPFSLKTINTHTELCMLCMDSLLDPQLQSKLQRCSPCIYQHRATSWSSHLMAADPARGDEQLVQLKRLFSGPGVLVWIFILASTGSLQVITQASSAVRLFAQRHRRRHCLGDPESQQTLDLEYLERWSRDLLRILSNFGSALTQIPDAIFNTVVPFTPSSSAIHQALRNLFSPNFSVQGLPQTWRDVVVELSTGKESHASQVCTSERNIAVSNSLGLVNVWSSETFHQISVLEHGETVSALCFSSCGDRIASYGTRTTKIWDFQVGQLLDTIHNPSDVRALFLSFDEDKALIAGVDRNSILKTSIIGSGQRGWSIAHPKLLKDAAYLIHTHLNTPSQILFSPDRTKVAVVHKSYPTTIWSLESGAVLKRISRAQKPGQTTKASSFVMRVAWHSCGDEILGLFMDGASFKLNLVDGSYSEMKPFDSQMPCDILYHPTGLIYAVRTASGAVHLFDYKTSALLYQFHLGELVLSACFSHDGRRLYAIRGSVCAVWEPDILMQISESDNHTVSIDTISDDREYRARLSLAETPSPILAMASSPTKSYALVGDEDGNVDLFSPFSSHKIRVAQTPTQLCIEHAAWSEDGLRFCFTEPHGRVVVMDIEERQSALKARLVAKFKVQFDEADIFDVVFLSEGKSLLVSSPLQNQIWTVQPAKMEAKVDLGSAASYRKWAWNRSSGALISATATGASVHEVGTLREVATCTWQRSPLQREVGDPSDLSKRSEAAETIIPTILSGHVLIRISRETPSRRLHSCFHILDTNNLSQNSTPLPIPQSVRDLVEMPLDVLLNEKLIFVDRSSWICSWPLRSPRGTEDVQRQFFIPRNWLPAESLGLMRMTAEGSILVPREGSVSVIKTMLCLEW